MIKKFFHTGVSLPQAGCAVGIAALSVLSFPPFCLWPLSLAAPCLFLLLIRKATTETARNIGLFYGFLYGLGTMYWLFGIFSWIAISLIALFAAYFGIFSTLVAATCASRSPLLRRRWLACSPPALNGYVVMPGTCVFRGTRSPTLWRSSLPGSRRFAGWGLWIFLHDMVFRLPGGLFTRRESG